MKKLLSLVVVAASLTLYSCDNQPAENEGTDVDTVRTETEINTNTEMNIDTAGQMKADTSMKMHSDTTKIMNK